MNKPYYLCPFCHKKAYNDSSRYRCQTNICIKYNVILYSGGKHTTFVVQFNYITKPYNYVIIYNMRDNKLLIACYPHGQLLVNMDINPNNLFITPENVETKLPTFLTFF